MLTDLKGIVQNRQLIIWVLLAGFVIQFLTSITAIGVSSADQHFQVVEFSMYQLGKPNGAIQVWEFDHFVRPTLQIYLFSAFHIAGNFLGITDPYAQLTLLRIILGLFMFTVFNMMALHFFRNAGGNTLLCVLLLINFSWALPYTRTLFSAEMMGSLFFFGSLLLYDYNKDRRPGWLLLMLTGFFFCLAFYFRFQMAFAMVGFGVWLIFFQRKYAHILPLALGFIAGLVLNLWLDHDFYKQWVFTPYTYFYANIIDGRADHFGRSSFLRYVGLVLLVTPAPLFSVIIFFFMLKAIWKNYTHPLVLTIVPFIVLHSLIGHKEERFMFPVFNVLPLLAGLTISSIERSFNNGRKWLGAVMAVLLGATLFLNTLFLAVMTIVPFSQTILFSKKLKERFESRPVALFCIGQTPFETPSGNEMEFYKMASRNISIDKIRRFNAGLITHVKPKYISASYNTIKGNFADLERMGYKPVMSSSDLLWGVNEFLHSRDINTINEIWMLYERNDGVN